MEQSLQTCREDGSGSKRGPVGGLPLELEKHGAGSTVCTAERRPGKLRQKEQTDVRVTRVRPTDPNPEPLPFRQEVGVRGRGARRRLLPSADFQASARRPAVASLPSGLRNGSVLPGAAAATALARSLGTRPGTVRTARARRGSGRPGLRLRRGGPSRRACAVVGRGGKEGGGGTGGGC